MATCELLICRKSRMDVPKALWSAGVAGRWRCLHPGLLGWSSYMGSFVCRASFLLAASGCCSLSISPRFSSPTALGWWSRVPQISAAVLFVTGAPPVVFWLLLFLFLLRLSNHCPVMADSPVCLPTSSCLRSLDSAALHWASDIYYLQHPGPLLVRPISSNKVSAPTVLSQDPLSPESS